MPQCSSLSFAENLPETSDFNGNYTYLKRLIQDLKVENSDSLKKELFGDTEPVKPFSKKDMKQLFKFLRKIEHHYENCQPPHSQRVGEIDKKPGQERLVTVGT